MELAEEKMDNFINFVERDIIPNQTEKVKSKLKELVNNLGSYPITMTAKYLTYSEEEFVNYVGSPINLNNNQREKIELYRNYFKELLSN